MKIKSFALVAAIAALVGHDALAATATSNFTVTAKVNPTCSITTTTLDFVTYDPFAAGALDVPNASGVTLTCSKGTGYTVSLSTGGSLSFTRAMKGTGANTDTLAYNIYRDAGYAQIWGDGTGATFTVTDTAPDKNSHSIAMYGRITAGQDVNQDTYSDTITATVTF